MFSVPAHIISSGDNNGTSVLPVFISTPFSTTGAGACSLSALTLRYADGSKDIVGTRYYNDSAGTTPFTNGGSNWFNVNGPRTVQIDSNGYVIDTHNCSP